MCWFFLMEVFMTIYYSKNSFFLLFFITHLARASEFSEPDIKRSICHIDKPTIIRINDLPEVTKSNFVKTEESMIFRSLIFDLPVMGREVIATFTPAVV